MLFVECKPDETLVRRLTRRSGKDIVHAAKGRDEVMTMLAGKSNCIAMVDEDPFNSPPPYFRRIQATTDYGEAGLRLMEHRRQRNRVILLRPRLEEWVIAAAEDVGIELAARRYNLPQNPISLHRAINHDLRKLERLIDDLIAANSPRILKLQELLTN